MADAGFYKGTSAEQDSRFANKQKKLLKQMKFPDNIDVKIDMAKVNLDVMKPWITKRLQELLGIDDDVVIEFVFNQLEEKHPDPKLMQINLTGFLGGSKARTFISELWALLASAQKSPDGMPAELVEMKKQELLKRQQEEERLREIRRREEETHRSEIKREAVKIDTKPPPNNYNNHSDSKAPRRKQMSPAPSRSPPPAKTAMHKKKKSSRRARSASSISSSSSSSSRSSRSRSRSKSKRDRKKKTRSPSRSRSPVSSRNKKSDNHKSKKYNDNNSKHHHRHHYHRPRRSRTRDDSPKPLPTKKAVQPESSPPPSPKKPQLESQIRVQTPPPPPEPAATLNQRARTERIVIMEDAPAEEPQTDNSVGRAMNQEQSEDESEIDLRERLLREKAIKSMQKRRLSHPDDSKAKGMGERIVYQA